MRKPLNTSVPEELITEIDQLVVKAKGSYRDRSHLVEQAIRAFMSDEIDADPAGRLANPVLQQALENASLYETSLFPRMRVHREEKRAIAEKAAGLIDVGMTLFVDGSTTCIELAKILARQKKRLTIVTNSTLVCLELGKTSEHKVIGIGGDFDPSSASFVGSLCEEAAQKYFVDLVVVSTKGLIPGEGTYESNTGTLRIKQVFARNTRQIILLVDHSKFHQKSLCKVLDIAQIHTIITDTLAPQEVVNQLIEQGHQVLVVPVKPAGER